MSSSSHGDHLVEEQTSRTEWRTELGDRQIVRSSSSTRSTERTRRKGNQDESTSATSERNAREYRSRES